MIGCMNCKRLDDICRGRNPYHVAHLVGGELVLADDFIESHKFIFIFGTHKERLSDLNSDERRDMMRSLAAIDEYIRRDGEPPIGVHYELLGDVKKHLHWHITPIYNKITVSQYADNHKRFWISYWEGKEAE